MNTKKEHKTKYVDDLLLQLSNAVTFPIDLKHPPIFDFSRFNGSFRNKLENTVVFRNLKYRSKTSVKHFSWKQCEVGKYTGNQLLRIMAALCRTLNSFLQGTCIVLTLNGDPDAAMYLLGPGWLEIKTPSPEEIEKRRYFDKIFNERSCRSMKLVATFTQYFENEKLNDIRAQVPQLLKSFLQQPIIDTRSEYRHAFIGMLLELVKFERYDAPVYDLTRQIPVASCIWLAIHNSMSHKLQSMFGDHRLPVKELFEKWRKETPNISTTELHQRLPALKAKIRLDAAKTILGSTIPVDSDGCYDTELIKKIVEQVKEFFQVSASY